MDENGTQDQEIVDTVVTGFLERMKAPAGPEGPLDEGAEYEEAADPAEAADSECSIPAVENTSQEISDASLSGFPKDDDEPDEDLEASFRSWWAPGAALGGVFGLILGGLVYFLVPGGDDSRLELTIGSSARAAASSAFGSLASVTEPEHRATRTEPGAQTPPAAGPAKPEAEPAVAVEPIDKPARRVAKSRTKPGKIRRTNKSRPPQMASEYRKLLRKGWARYHKQEFHPSSVAFSRAVHLAPHRTGGYFGLALSLFEQGAEDGAMQVLERGVKKVGPKADLWILAGSIYQFRGKQRLARMAYRRYLRANPRGKYARDVRVILKYEDLPQLLPFTDETEQAPLASH